MYPAQRQRQGRPRRDDSPACQADTCYWVPENQEPGVRQHFLALTHPAYSFKTTPQPIRLIRIKIVKIEQVMRNAFLRAKPISPARQRA